MGIETWGSLAKDQTNAQLITEAISEAITAHEADPTAHLGAGESLEQHKTNEVIDHPAFSVLDDKFAYDRNYIDVKFNNLDLFDKSAGVENQGLETVYFYASGLNNKQWLGNYAGDVASGNEYLFSKLPRIITKFMVGTISNATSYLIVGELDEGRGFGFKIVNGNLYGIYFKSDFSEQTLLLQTISANTVYKLEARVISTTEIEFWINNLLVDTFENCIFPTTNNFLFQTPWIQIKKTATGSAELYVRNFYWEADY